MLPSCPVSEFIVASGALPLHGHSLKPFGHSPYHISVLWTFFCFLGFFSVSPGLSVLAAYSATSAVMTRFFPPPTGKSGAQFPAQNIVCPQDLLRFPSPLRISNGFTCTFRLALQIGLPHHVFFEKRTPAQKRPEYQNTNE